MRIAGFIRLLPVHRGVGGMQGHAQNLYRGLAKRGHDVHVFTTEHPDKQSAEIIIEEGVTIHFLKGTPEAVYSKEYSEKSKQAFFAAHKEKPFDVIHTESTAAAGLCGCGVPVVATWHGMGFCAFRSKLNAEIVHNTLKTMTAEAWQSSFAGVMKEIEQFQKYDFHIAISDQAYDDLLAVYKLPKSRVSLVYNGFDTSQFKIDRAAGLNIRKKLKIPEKAYVIGGGGRLTVDKGHRLMVSALQLLLPKLQDLHFILLGKGGLEREYLALKHDRVHYVGPQPYSEMMKYYNAMNLFINPTMAYHGLDMVMQEAMMCGVPVIATDTGSIKKSLLPDSRHGATFPLGDVNSIVGLVSGFRPPMLAKMGEIAHEFIKSKSSLERMCEGMEKVFATAKEKGPQV